MEKKVQAEVKGYSLRSVQWFKRMSTEKDNLNKVWMFTGRNHGHMQTEACKHGMEESLCSICQGIQVDMENEIPKLTDLDRRENVKAIFDDSEYGEAWIGMAYHTMAMGTLDRMISEDCYPGAKITHPRIMINDGKLFWQRAEWLSQKLETNTVTAESLIESWNYMNATTKMVMEFIEWIKKHGLIHGFVYFRHLATQLSEADPEVEAWDDEDYDNDEEEELNELPASAYRYIPVGVTPMDEENEWIENQPEAYQDKIERLREIDRLDILEKVGKNVYEKKDSMNRAQSGVFWTIYKARKKVLTKRTELGFQKLIDFIKNTNKHMGWVGKYLFIVKADGKVILSNSQWTEIWNTWKERKGAPAGIDRGQVNY